MQSICFIIITICDVVNPRLFRKKITKDIFLVYSYENSC